MKLTRMRIVGFKSFCDPTELLIEPGLTGVVGPNGCGKSNLVEALRWAMGETSYKAMRGSGMDDVIFAGSGTRPARNIAEVILSLDNRDHRAPAAFNAAEELQVSRSITRESGSTYRVNAREVRARDVQLLFADAASGARSSALVRQGQIGELIAAKPEGRRRIIEDAAGVAGLHGRRHEAEQRLRAAEDNLARLNDVLGQLSTQLDALRRQSRQAARFRHLSAEIRRHEALILLLRWREVSESLTQARDAFEAASRAASADTQRLSDANRARAVAAAGIPERQQTLAELSAGLSSLTQRRDALAAEEKRVVGRAREVERILATIADDLAREEALGRETGPVLERLRTESAWLDAEEQGASDVGAEVAQARAHAEAQLGEAETALGGGTEGAARRRAGLAGLARRVTEEQARLDRLARDRDASRSALAALAPPEDAALAGARREAESARTALAAAEQAAEAAEAALAGARDEATRTERGVAEQDRVLGALRAELRTLRTLVAPPDAGTRTAYDSVTVEPGFEAALGAALGDDLDAPLDGAAPVHWRAVAVHADDPALPEGAEPLSSRVEAPDALTRRLAQTGLVDNDLGPALQPRLKPGQSLVTRDGHLWRWDGLVTAADAPTAAARRLTERNRLAAREAALADAEADVAARRAAALQAKQEADARRQVEVQAREALRQARRRLDAARDELARAERAGAQAQARRAALEAELVRIEDALQESAAALSAAQAEHAAAASEPDLDPELTALREAVGRRRQAFAAALARAQSLERESELRARRRAAVAQEIAAWTRRQQSAVEQAERLRARESAAREEEARLADRPLTLGRERRAVSAELDGLDGKRRSAAEALTQAEAELRRCEKHEQEAQAALSRSREARAAGEARLEAARERHQALAAQIQDALETAPEALPALAGLEPSTPLPDIKDVERSLDSLRQDRERLGGVNLRAEEEAQTVREEHERLGREREDVEQAIRKLRSGIQGLNREARERLVQAFEAVNGHFQTLFTTLFGGGTAELTWCDADDPLQAGLDIIARPPGKRPQTLTLLSGGEQALTATALIFAVFLTNPAPICVLDEVDAPLDDHNVARLCALLERIVEQTDTRFLVITHNPITMARMDRLYGVTMAERGVSQLVSVDLAAAERVLEAV
jgi:chromosome segregation protein